MPHTNTGSVSHNASTMDLAVAPGVRTCGTCQQPVVGQSVRALGLFYHMECFCCKECRVPVADKFFPLYAKSHDGTPSLPALYCERHYFALHGLLCDKCGQALRGPHINALGKKFHLDHFTCTVCPKVFRQHDSYYEREGKVYCQFHYSVLFAAKCGGCQTAVLKKFVEMKKEGVLYQWHPQCYMIYKLWNVKANFQHGSTLIDDKSNPEAEIARQTITLAKVDKIISVLSSFEDSSANCIGDMMSHFSHRRYAEVCLYGHRFIEYVDAMFIGIEVIDRELVQAGGEGIVVGRKEPRQLAKRIVHFFSLLSQTGGSTTAGGAEEERRKEAVKREMIDLVTMLANTLKSLIRLALNGALRMEREFGSDTCIMSFLSLLATLETTNMETETIADLFSAMSMTSNNR
ncbi:hypothetical protein HDU98_005438, partial [Podochytrium sp. JEL0797]